MARLKANRINESCAASSGRRSAPTLAAWHRSAPGQPARRRPTVPIGIRDLHRLLKQFAIAGAPVRLQGAERFDAEAAVMANNEGRLTPGVARHRQASRH